MNAKLIFAAMCIAFSSFFTTAQAPSGTTPQPIPKEKKPGIWDKSKSPELIEMYFSYDAVAEECIFTLPLDVDYIDITLENEDTHIIYMGFASSDNPVWEQSLSNGEYYITCNADNGKTYAGLIYIE